MAKLSTKQMAKHLGVSVRLLNQYGRNGTLERDSNYLWDRDRTERAYYANVQVQKGAIERRQKRSGRKDVGPGPVEPVIKAHGRKGFPPKVMTLEGGGFLGEGLDTLGGNGNHKSDSTYGSGPESYTTGPVPNSQAEWTLRKTRAEALQKELDVRTKASKLVDTDDVRKVWSSQISSVKNTLLLLPAKLAPKLAGVDEVLDCQAILDGAIRQVLTELSEYTPPPPATAQARSAA